jgi:hypothetical protein
MLTIKELEKAVSALPPEELREFRQWFEKFEAALWDQQFEEDAKSGRLDRVAEQAIKDYRKGKFKPL